MTVETKKRVFDAVKEASPLDLSIVETSRKAGVSEPTAAMYIRVLEAEGKIEFTRTVGRSKMFRLKT